MMSNKSYQVVFTGVVLIHKRKNENGPALRAQFACCDDRSVANDHTHTLNEQNATSENHKAKQSGPWQPLLPPVSPSPITARTDRHVGTEDTRTRVPNTCTAHSSTTAITRATPHQHHNQQQQHKETTHTKHKHKNHIQLWVTGGPTGRRWGRGQRRTTLHTAIAVEILTVQ